MIDVWGFTKVYRDLEAVHSLTLHVNGGDIYGLVGPNGAGKTTTFRFLATLLLPTRGAAEINGYDVVRKPHDVRRSIGHMPDTYGLYYGMRVWEFLDFFAAAHRIPRAKRRAVISDLLELVDLGRRRDDPVQTLSRGMRQRLCLAKTLVHDPPVLILDEPASGLDPRARLEVKELLRELRRMGKTILMSSHILPELADVCNKIGFLERGVLLAAGEIEAILSQIRQHHVIEIRVAGDHQRELEQALSAEDHIHDLRSDGEMWTVEFTGGEAEQAALLARLVQRGIAVREFRERPVNLEEAFIKITKGEVT